MVREPNDLAQRPAALGGSAATPGSACLDSPDADYLRGWVIVDPENWTTSRTPLLGVVTVFRKGAANE